MTSGSSRILGSGEGRDSISKDMYTRQVPGSSKRTQNDRFFILGLRIRRRDRDHSVGTVWKGKEISSKTYFKKRMVEMSRSRFQGWAAPSCCAKAERRITSPTYVVILWRHRPHFQMSDSEKSWSAISSWVSKNTRSSSFYDCVWLD